MKIYGKVKKQVNYVPKEELEMAVKVTNKKPLFGNKRSHALNATRRKWNVNLQKATIMVNGKPQKVYVSARALRTLKKGA